MNRRQKIVQQRFLDNEKAVIDELEKTYKEALTDINKNIKKLDVEIQGIKGKIKVFEDSGEMTEEDKEILQSQLQAKIYQKQYQEAIHGQIDTVLDTMNEKQFTSVSDYLNTCYDDGFVGTMYDLQGQGIPLTMPINQENVVRAVQTDSKISQGLYTRMGEDVNLLKKTIAAEVSRGIVTGATYDQIAKQISYRMTGTEYGNGGALYRAKTIARTEGHRIQCTAAMDACYSARDMGADVVKQWDSTLDGRTRPTHIALDHEIRELDEPFSNGLMFPGDSHGKAAEVVNCRCSLDQRGRWWLENAGFTKMNNFTKEIETFESPAQYDEFKKAFFSKENRQFMNYHERLEERYGTKNFEKLLGNMTDAEYKHWQKLYNSSPVYNKAAKSTAEAVKNDADRQAQIRARREAWKKRHAEQTKTTATADFDSMDKKQLESWAAEHLKTPFVNTKGVNTDFMRETVKVVNQLEQKIGGTIDGLKVSYGTVSQGRYAAYDFKTKTLHLKKTGSLDAFAESQRKVNARSQRKLKRNYYASETYSGTVWHELGHAVDDDTGQSLSKALSATKELDVKSAKISVYAGSSPAINSPKRSEAWAENFSAYMDGAKNAKDVPPEIVEMIEDYFRKKKGS